MRGRLAKAYEIKAEFLGPAGGVYQSELSILNRTVRWTAHGLEYEADQRHAELIIQHAGVETGKPVAMPCCTDAENDETKRLDSGALVGTEATAYREVAARLNFLAMDRTDLQYAAKEVTKHMPNPCNLDWVKIKRVGRYLVGAPRYVQQYLWQEFGEHVDAFSDFDLAGD